MGWGVGLEGHEFDLLDWRDALKPPFDPWVEAVTLGDQELYLLRSADLDATTFDEVFDRGRVLVSRINGAMALERGSEPLQTNSVIEIRADGTISRHYRIAVGTARGRSRASAVSVTISRDGVPLPAPPPQPSSVQRWQQAAEASAPDDEAAKKRADLVADLLVYLGKCDNWFDVYKAIEAAEKLAGSEHTLLRLAGSDRPAIKDAKTTANYYRHARSTSKPTVSIKQARQGAFIAARLVLG